MTSHRVRRRRGPTRPHAVPGPGAAGHRGAGPSRRGVCRQDRHADRERHAGKRTEVAESEHDVGERACAAGRRRRPPQRQHGRDRRGVQDAAGLDGDGERAVQVGDEVERRRRTASTATGSSVRPTCCSTRARPKRSRPSGSERVGLRVLLLGSSDRLGRCRGRARRRSAPAALVVLEQRVRPDARDTLDYFAAQKVTVKVISGDNAVSVGAVAGSLGLHGETLDARRTARRRRRTGRHARRSTPPSAACGPTRSGPWCTRCSRGATRSR